MKKRKKVSFRAEPEIKLMDSYNVNESSMELTNDFEKVISCFDGMNGSFDFVFNEFDENDLNLSEDIVSCDDNMDSMVKDNTKYNEFRRNETNPVEVGIDTEKDKSDEVGHLVNEDKFHADDAIIKESQVEELHLNENISLINDVNANIVNEQNCRDNAKLFDIGLNGSKNRTNLRYDVGTNNEESEKETEFEDVQFENQYSKNISYALKDMHNDFKNPNDLSTNQLDCIGEIIRKGECLQTGLNIVPSIDESKNLTLNTTNVIKHLDEDVLDPPSKIKVNEKTMNDRVNEIINAQFKHNKTNADQNENNTIGLIANKNIENLDNTGSIFIGDDQQKENKRNITMSKSTYVAENSRTFLSGEDDDLKNDRARKISGHNWQKYKRSNKNSLSEKHNEECTTNISQNNLDSSTINQHDTNEYALNTRDLRNLVPSSRITLDTLLKNHKVHFFDKSQFAKTRRETFSTAGLSDHGLIFSHFYQRHLFAYLRSFTDYLVNVNEERQKTIENMEVMLIDPDNKKIVGIKKKCRDYALSEWYMIKLKWQERFFTVLNDSQNHLLSFLSQNNYECEIENLKVINDNLRQEILNKKKLCTTIKKDKIEERIAVLKNYFKKSICRYSENYSTEQVDCMQFIAINISYDALKDNASILIDMLDNQKTKKHIQYTAMQKRKTELEETINKLDKEITIYEEKYTLKNIHEKDCEIMKKKYKLLLAIHKMEVIKVQKNNIVFTIHNFKVTIMPSMSSNFIIEPVKKHDVYEWGVPKVRKDKLYNLISDLYVLECIKNEVGDSIVCLNGDMLELVLNNGDVLLFDMQNLKIIRNESVMYDGKRNDGALKTMLH